jgi:CO/xanthine dehydrogenase FAD-binding subunit
LNLRALCCSCSDTAPALVALGAHIKIAGPSGEKMIPLEKFFILPSVDYKRENILTGGEIVTEIIVPAPKPVARVSTTKYGSGSPGTTPSLPSRPSSRAAAELCAMRVW